VGEDQDSKRQDSINTDESLIGGNENRQRDGAAGLRDCRKAAAAVQNSYDNHTNKRLGFCDPSRLFFLLM
jgi:hypothetical protein